MKSLQKLTYEATLKPEKFMFFTCNKGSDDAIRYLLLFEVNLVLTKKIIIVCEDGSFEECNGFKTALYACFEPIEAVEADIKKAGYEPISLRDFVTSLVSMSVLYNDTIHELI